MIDIKELRSMVNGAQFESFANSVIHSLLNRLEAAESEALEEARLNGMGGEREAALLSKLEAAEKETASWKGLAKQFGNEADAMRAKLKAAEKECNTLRADKATLQRMAYSLKDHLEVAEKERDELRAELKEIRYGLAVAHDTIKALRDKVEAIERQEPVAWLHESRRDSDVVTNAVKHVWGKAAVGSMAAYSIPLYTLPGAKREEK